MTRFEDLQALTGSIQMRISIPGTRFNAYEMDLPFLPPPYTSMIDDVMIQNTLHKYKDNLRQIAMHPVKLQAGQSNLPAGELGRPAAPLPVLVPEMLGGRLLTTNV